MALPSATTIQYAFATSLDGLSLTTSTGGPAVGDIGIPGTSPTGCGVMDVDYSYPHDDEDIEDKDGNFVANIASRHRFEVKVTAQAWSRDADINIMPVGSAVKPSSLAFLRGAATRGHFPQSGSAGSYAYTAPTNGLFLFSDASVKDSRNKPGEVSLTFKFRKPAGSTTLGWSWPTIS